MENNLQEAARRLTEKMIFDMKYGHLYPKRKREVFSNRFAKNKYLYFIACGDAVKIGMSSDPTSRIETLAVGAPGQLYLIAMIPNMGHRENEFHKRFTHLHLRGEWFKYTNEIHELIKELTA